MRELGLELPPGPMPLVRGGRPLKRWRYLGVFAPDAMLCAAEVAIGPLHQRFWALAEPGGALHGHTALGSGSMLASTGSDLGRGELAVGCSGARCGAVLDHAAGPPAVESVSFDEHGGYVWTCKQAGIPARLRVGVGGRSLDVEAEGVLDDTAGYHRRRTSWSWSAGVGRARAGEQVAWSLVEGVGDAREGSERTVWVDGDPFEPGPISFAHDLSRLVSEEGAELRHSAWASREHAVNALILSSRIRQPFGTFAGVLPGGLELAEGYGVMESHEARW